MKNVDTNWKSNHIGKLSRIGKVNKYVDSYHFGKWKRIKISNMYRKANHRYRKIDKDRKSKDISKIFDK